MYKMLVPQDAQKVFRFEGEMVGEALGTPDRVDPEYRDSKDRWSELRLYSTLDGRYVCEQVRSSHWKGGNERHRAAVCETEREVMEFFGKSRLAKELYLDANIYCVEQFE